MGPPVATPADDAEEWSKDHPGRGLRFGCALGYGATIGPIYELAATTSSYHFLASPLGFDPM